jgi:hypothetical protein
VLNWGYQLEVPTGKRDKVPSYEVKIQVNYVGTIVANSEAEAEEKAWTAYYGKNAVLEYDSVESIEVEEQEEEEDEEEKEEEEYEKVEDEW